MPSIEKKDKTEKSIPKIKYADLTMTFKKRIVVGDFCVDDGCDKHGRSAQSAKEIIDHLSCCKDYSYGDNSAISEISDVLNIFYDADDWKITIVDYKEK